MRNGGSLHPLRALHAHEFPKTRSAAPRRGYPPSNPRRALFEAVSQVAASSTKGGARRPVAPGTQVISPFVLAQRTSHPDAQTGAEVEAPDADVDKRRAGHALHGKSLKN
ncbi:MAG: hypothetical protein ACK54X_22685 [Burkholderiales bacterium]|jgi:hypothetical protein